MIFLTLHSSCSILGEIPQLFHYILTIQPPCPKYRGAISSIILLTVTCDHRVGGRAAFLLGLSRSWVGWEWVIHIREEGGGHDSVHCFRLHSRTCNSRTFLVQVIPSPMTIKHQGYSFLFYLNCPCFIVIFTLLHLSAGGKYGRVVILEMGDKGYLIGLFSWGHNQSLWRQACLSPTTRMVAGMGLLVYFCFSLSCPWSIV